MNRTLAFSAKYFDNSLPHVEIDTSLREKTRSIYESVGEKIERGLLKEALDLVFGFVRFGNKYYDAEQPWKTRLSNPEKCRETIACCIYLIANQAVLLNPFLPFSSEKVIEWLGTKSDWKEQEATASTLPESYSILFNKIN